MQIQTQEMVDLRGFRIYNKLTQGQVSAFLGLSVAFISAIERGMSRLPGEQLVKLINNDQGWDTRLLTDGDPIRYSHNYKCSVGQSFESTGEHCEIKNFQGYTKEDVDREVSQKMVVFSSQIEALEKEVQHYKEEVAYLKCKNDELSAKNDRLQDKVIELLEQGGCR